MTKTKIWDQVSQSNVHTTCFRMMVLAVPPLEEPVLKISYVLSIYSSAQMKLAKSKCKLVGWPLELNSKAPWSTVSAQILVQIDDALSLTNFNIDNYKISYTVPCHISQPLPLTSATGYAHLIANATKGKTATLSAKLTVIQKTTQVHKYIHLIILGGVGHCFAWQGYLSL